MATIVQEQTPHTLTRYEAELRQLRAMIGEMGRLAEQMLQQALQTVLSGPLVLSGVIAEEERTLNALERSVDRCCNQILATQHPAASDLRLVVGILKAATDLERIGDESKKIYRLGTRLHMLDAQASGAGQRYLGELVVGMLRAALQALETGEAEQALAAARGASLIDEEYERIQRRCVTLMMEHPRAVRQTLDLMWIIRALERIGDHAGHLCAHAAYIASGRPVTNL